MADTNTLSEGDRAFVDKYKKHLESETPNRGDYYILDSKDQRYSISPTALKLQSHKLFRAFKSSCSHWNGLLDARILDVSESHHCTAEDLQSYLYSFKYVTIRHTDPANAECDAAIDLVLNLDRHWDMMRLAHDHDMPRLVNLTMRKFEETTKRKPHSGAPLRKEECRILECAIESAYCSDLHSSIPELYLKKPVCAGLVELLQRPGSDLEQNMVKSRMESYPAFAIDMTLAFVQRCQSGRRSASPIHS